VLALKNNQVLVIGHTGQQFPAFTFALGDDYSLRAAHDTAINYIRSTMQVIPPQKINLKVPNNINNAFRHFKKNWTVKMPI